MDTWELRVGPLSVQRAVFLSLPGKIWWARERVGEKAGRGRASFVSFSHSWETEVISGYFLFSSFLHWAWTLKWRPVGFHLDKFSPILLWVQLGACWWTFLDLTHGLWRGRGWGNGEDCSDSSFWWWWGGQCLETFLVFASRGCHPCLVGRGQESSRVSYNARMTPHSSYLSGPQV